MLGSFASSAFFSACSSAGGGEEGRRGVALKSRDSTVLELGGMMIFTLSRLCRNGDPEW